jgi:hypothetical protein
MLPMGFAKLLEIKGYTRTHEEILTILFGDGLTA